CGSAERVSEHADAAEVESSCEDSRSREAGELGEHEPRVGNAYRERSRDVHLRGRDDDVPVRELDDAGVMRVVDRDNHIAVAGEVLYKARVELAFDAEPGREENNRPAASTLQRHRV